MIRAVHAGKRNLSPEVSFQIADHMSDDSLTPAEIAHDRTHATIIGLKRGIIDL